MSAESREKIRQATLGRHHSPESIEKMRQAQLGRKPSPQTIEASRQAHLGKPLSPEHRRKVGKASRGRKWSAESRERARQSAMARSTPEYREGIRQKLVGRHHNAERRAAISRGLAKPGVREKCRRARLRWKPQKMTSIENALYQEFKKRRLIFEMHRSMFGRWQPDFVFEKAMLIVQADGTRWHKWPEKQARDRAFNETALTEGWTVWRFGEQKINMHAVACARAVAGFVRDHR